jgi:hypothetical protein
MILSKNTNPIYYDPNLHNYHHYHHYLQNIASWKWVDQRLELIEIPKGIVEILQTNGFTIEKILDSEPSVIADRLGIDSYVGELIKKETSKAISKIDPDLVWY